MVLPQDLSIYGGRDPRLLPIYTLDEAAHILWIPASTLKVWTFGGKWHESSGRPRSFVSLIIPPSSDDLMLSFVNLIEAHVLHAIRRVHRIKMSRVRAAMKSLREDFRTSHPLADVDIFTQGQNIIASRYGRYVNLSHGKQLEIEQVIEIYLRRVEREEDKIARFYPFSSGEPIIKGPAVEEQPKLVSIDPFVSFGRPVLAGTNIRTEIVAERFYAGDSIDDLVADYHLQKELIEAAVRYERRTSPAVEADA